MDRNRVLELTDELCREIQEGPVRHDRRLAAREIRAVVARVLGILEADGSALESAKDRMYLRTVKR